MGNDRDDKFEGHEESEYHFSDEEVSYEVEPETPKQPSPPGGGGEPKEGFLNQIMKSKRMLISIAVFLVLVFIVYKMVSPSSSVPSTNITAAPTVAQKTPLPQAPALPQAAQNAAATAAAPAAATVPVVPPVPGAMSQAPTSAVPNAAAPIPSSIPPPGAQLSAMPAAPTSATSPVAAQTPNTMMVPPSGAELTASHQAAAMQQQPVVMPTAPTAATVPQQPVAPQQLAGQVPAGPVAPQQLAGQVPTGPVAPQEVAPFQAPATVVAGVPGVAPVQTQTPGASYNVNVNQPAPGPEVSPVTGGNAEALTANTDRLMGQLQATYAQRLNEYSTENKALQDQVQTLNARIGAMENQLNQLVQVLTRERGLTSNTNAALPATEVVEVVPRVAFNVQAIIPGRAWLKSDNGETLTVAEGDVIKGLGRVTKIDPYDGLVEINTGSKSISLSYGNGG